MEKEAKVDPRVKRTRQLLQKALADLLAEKTFHNITVQDIAERAEVNRATFYAHFEDKYALLNFSVRERFQGMLDQRLPAAPTFTLDNLRILTMTVGEYMREFVGHCLPTTGDQDEVQMMRQVQVQTYETILNWVKDSGKHGNTSPEIIATATSWVIFGTTFQWAQSNRKLSLEQVTDQVMSILMSGLQAHA